MSFTRQEAMSKKLELLQKAKERLVNIEKLQYAPEDKVEFNFMNHFYFFTGVVSTDIVKVGQSAVGVLLSPITIEEKKISMILNKLLFTAMELAQLETFSLLGDRVSLIRELHRMMRLCMVGAASTVEEES
ncbi:hypothetical protein [Paenibacillus periandrae]|uniref:hypothetical protein n=1 Tax=Paenibacillus periandrae TaxID=1761741 RepID=UPI001F08A82E|nr:hypothetical protein [Paenibacillus periandrae]